MPFDAADHLRAALPDLPAHRRGAADHGDGAVLADRRLAGCCGCSATTCRSRPRSGSSRWPASTAEFGVVMLLYLKHALRGARRRPGAPTARRCASAIEEGAVLRVRPKAMTVAVIVAGLLPIMWSAGTGVGSDAAHRGADGRRHDHRAASVDVRDPGGVLPDAPA